MTGGRANAKGLLLDRSGSVAVEFTVIAALLLGVVFAIIETGFTFLFGLALENATQQLARMIQTGQAQQLGVTSSADLIAKIICPAGGAGLLPSFLDCTRLVVDLRSASNYASDPSIYFYKQPSQYCASAADKVLVLRLAYGMPVFLPALALGNAVFGPSTAGIVDDFPNAVGWTHLLANATTFKVESSNTDGSTTGGSSGC